MMIYLPAVLTVCTPPQSYRIGHGEHTMLLNRNAPISQPQELHVVARRLCGGGWNVHFACAEEPSVANAKQFNATIRPISLSTVWTVTRNRSEKDFRIEQLTANFDDVAIQQKWQRC
jgi:hypothetical protein